MNQYPLDICITIWEFAGLNTVFLNKNLMKFIKRKKKMLERNPLVIYYRLVKLKETNYAYGNHFGSMTRISNSRRPSIAVDKIVKNIVLNGNWPMGELLNNTKNIKPSKVLSDRLIPCSTCSYGEDRYHEGYFRSKVTYWELYEIYCDDITKAKDYIRLYPYNGKITSLSRYSDLASGIS